MLEAGRRGPEAGGASVVDDRAVCFRGDFERTLAEVIAFRAHWEETPADG